MTKILRLIEDWPLAGAVEMLPSGTPRSFYVAAGTVTINGKETGTDDGYVSTDKVTLQVGGNGATVWRWEVVDPAASTSFIGNRGAKILEGPIDEVLFQNGALIRLDSVAFPPGGIAMLHTHQGPGIRRLSEGSIRIDTQDDSGSYGPGGAWFETGPDEVFAQASEVNSSRFIRTMILPNNLLGSSSIAYAREEDKNKPKSQNYRGFGEVLIEDSNA
jgi:hypothetical protein